MLAFDKLTLLFSSEDTLSLCGPESESERQDFFFEKKKQKNFHLFRLWLLRMGSAKYAKVFWFFFSKKNRLLWRDWPRQLRTFHAVLTRNIRDFDLMNQILPAGQVVFYRTS